MSNLENELKDLRENNNELVQKVQYWKMTAAQRESRNIELMKEVTELRLKLSRLRNGGDIQAHKLDTALQGTSEEVLSHLVQASNAVARTMELVKTYMHERQELESSLPRWSTISDSHSTKKINKVRPMLIGGRTVQPFVLLDRTLDGGNPETSQNQSHNVSERAIPMHMLLDVYIPLRRIDADDLPANNEDNDEDDNRGDDSVEGLGLEEADDRISDESHNMTDGEGFEESRRLDAVIEDVEPGEEEQTPQRAQADNPLEGPSWLLDRPSLRIKSNRSNLEPDSTTSAVEAAGISAGPSLNNVRRNSQQDGSESVSGQTSPADPGPGTSVPRTLGPPDWPALPGLVVPSGGDSVFSPTVRRRRRASPPPPVTPRSPRPDHVSPHPGRRSSVCKNAYSNGGRILKVLVPKMRFDDGTPRGMLSPVAHRALALQAASSPTLPVRVFTRAEPESQKRSSRDSAPVEASPKRPVMRFDAPSPNGATDARVIVMESNSSQPEPCSSGLMKDRVKHGRKRLSSHESLASGDSQVSATAESDSEGDMLADRRPRRQKKAVVYKEKPLNRKMRR